MPANPLLVPTELARLLEACRTTLLACTHPSVKVAAAVSDSKGAVHTGVQVRSANCGHCATCAEPVAIGAALAAGAATLTACVAMVRDRAGPRVWSPCGTCREMLRDFGVVTVVVAQTSDGHPVTATPDDLLPWP
jgi:cytidine deaminase